MTYPWGSQNSEMAPEIPAPGVHLYDPLALSVGRTVRVMELPAVIRMSYDRDEEFCR